MMAALSQCMKPAALAGMLVQPETDPGWHRDLVRRKFVTSPDRFGDSEVLIKGTVRGATPFGAPWEALASP